MYNTKQTERPSLQKKITGAFHSTKILGNSGWKANKIDGLRTFVSKISINLSELYSFPENWKFRKFLVPFGISTLYEWALVPLVHNIASTKAQYKKRRDCTTICRTLRLFLTAYPPQKGLGSDFLENCGLVISNFLSLVCINLPREKFASFSHHSKRFLTRSEEFA